MAQTDAQRREAARSLAARLFDRQITANLDLDNLWAAVGSIDTAMETVIATIPAAWQTKTVKQALIDNLPEPFQSTSTAQQKGLALAVWAMKESGII